MDSRVLGSKIFGTTFLFFTRLNQRSSAVLSELLWAARKKAESTKVSISSCEIDLRAEDSRSALSEIDLRA